MAAGVEHSAALTDTGCVYTWGGHGKGQLGVGQPAASSQAAAMVFSPVAVDSLAGIPLAGLVCGGHHTMVASRSGAVFAWGANSAGQLGLGDDKDRSWPCQVCSIL